MEKKCTRKEIKVTSTSINTDKLSRTKQTVIIVSPIRNHSNSNRSRAPSPAPAVPKTARTTGMEATKASPVKMADNQSPVPGNFLPKHNNRTKDRKDRKSVVKGKRVSGRVDLGCRRRIKRKIKTKRQKKRQRIQKEQER